MRFIWSLLTAVIVAGAVALLWPEREASRGSDLATPAQVARAPRPDAVGEIATGKAPVADPAPKAAPASRAASPTAGPPPIPAPASSAALGPERLPDGTLRLDGRFIVSGSGSEQDPLVLSWPLLASASEAIDASKGRTVPPPHIAFLNGQWVQISAFLAPPLWGERTTELLVMKNRWDGCCIGLPPTPFDCIEATLAAPITLGAKHSVSFGTVRGRLVVEPFTAGAFLIGLYRLESAQLEDMKPQ